MPSLSGITEIIGVRAVIIDVRQYLADGREIERTNDRMAASELKLQKASETASRTANAAQAARSKANTDFAAASIARQKLIQKETELQTAAAKVQAKPAATTGLVSPAGQPISTATTAANTAAIADVARLKNEVKLAKNEFNDLARVAIISGHAESRAGTEAAAGLRAQNAALAEQTRLNEQLAAAQSSRRRAAASGVALIGTAVVAGTAAAAISSAAKYQQELSKINVLTSATDKETEQLGQQFLTLSTQIPVSASDLAAAAYKLLSSGIKDTGEALIITTQAAKAAVAGQAEIKDIIAATIAVLNGYPKGAITATQVNDILFAGVKEGAAEFNDFAGSIGKLIPVAAALGVPFDQLTASLAVLTNGGLNAEEAATGLRAILNDLAKDEGSKQAKDALAEFGLTVEQLRKNILEKGLPQAMGELITLFNGNLAAIEPIIPNIRGMVAAFSAFQNSGQTTIGVLKNIDSAGGIVDQSFEKTKNNVANLAQIFKNELNVALIQIGNAVLPSVTAALQDLIKWFDANKDSISKFVSEGLQGIINLGSDAAKGIGAIATALSDLDGILKSLVGQSDLTKVALAGIATALVWALPGGPYIVGLTAILVLLGKIQDIAKEGIDTPIGHLGAPKTGLDKLKDEREKLLKDLGEQDSNFLDKLNTLAGKITPKFVRESGGFPVGSEEQKRARLAEIDSQIAQQQADDDKKKADAAKLLSDAAKPLTDITLPKLAVNVGGVDEAAKKAAEDLKKFAEDFKKESEKLGEIDSVTKDLEKFGQGLGIVQISLQNATKAGLSASQAGEVAGIDAVIRAQERAKAEAFNYIEAVTAITAAWQQNAATGRALAEELAQAALSASQQALSAVFSRPTQEVANLGVPLAQQQLQTARLTQQADPRIFSLNQQLKNIDKQIAAQNRANAAANRAAERAKRDQERANRAAEQTQQAALDQQKIANLVAQQNAERQLAALQKLIDANNKAASDLQEAFIKSNNDLQVQINTAIGKGDSGTALALVDQQRAATKQYRDQSKALQKSNQDLTTQQKAQQEAEAERQRQVALNDAVTQSQQKQKASTDDLSQSIDDNKASQDDQTQALQDQKDKIQEQIKALQDPIDASKQQEQTIQDSIAVYEAQTAVLKAQGVAADKTLLTQKQQAEAAKHFTQQVEYASGQAKALAKNFYDFIPGAHEADEAIRTLKGVVESVHKNLTEKLNPGFDAAAERLKLLDLATQDVIKHFNDLSGTKTGGASTAGTPPSVTTGQEQQLLAGLEPVSPSTLKSVDDLITKLDSAKTIISNIKPPNTGDFGLAATQTATTAAQTYGFVLDTQINPPDISDAGRQTIDNAISSTYTYNQALNNISKPDVGDAGRGEILGALDAARQLSAALRNIGTQVADIGKNLTNKIKDLLIPKHSQGGVFTKATLGIIGEAGPEVVLPLNDVNRIAQILKQTSASSLGSVATSASLDSSGILNQITSAIGHPAYQGILGATGSGGGTTGGLAQAGLRGSNYTGYNPIGLARDNYAGGNAVLAKNFQPPIIAQLSPALTAALTSQPQAPAVFSPNITVTGQTLDTMEATAIAAVQRAFRDARNASTRTGGLITTGLGPTYSG